jgi:hypothetical protein
MNIYNLLRKLAKETKYQNLFTIVKDLHTIKLFKNRTDLSNLQEMFLNYLYMYESINRDIMVERISKHVFDCELYEDAYLLYKKENKHSNDIESSKPSNVHLVLSDKINFNKR